MELSHIIRRGNAEVLAKLRDNSLDGNKRHNGSSRRRHFGKVFEQKAS